MQRRLLRIDGKIVRCWLFAHVVTSTDGKKFPQLAQVQAFTLDHAVKRLQELYPMIPKHKWEMLEELDPEHDVGAMGRFHPLFPMVTGSRLIQ
jgi:hypothetical protein